MDLLKKLICEEEGQGMVEYALIIALVAVLLIGGLIGMKDKIAAKFTEVGNTLDNGGTTTTP